jgi:hypothetical protein
MADTFSNPHLAAWDSSLASSADYARRVSGELYAATMAQRPSWGGWSVGEIFEHLCVTDGLYEAPLRALLIAERERATPRLSPAWRPTIWGRLLLWSLNPANTRKSQAPPAFRITTAPRERVVDAWLAQVETTRVLMHQADGLDLRRLKLSSPAARLIRLNAGDAFAVLAVHAARHMGQIRRTIADVMGSGASAD